MESRMREIRTYGLMRGKSHRRQRRGVGLYSTGGNAEAWVSTLHEKQGGSRLVGDFLGVFNGLFRAVAVP